jgi:tungstate transport system substrate-binding protein
MKTVFIKIVLVFFCMATIVDAKEEPLRVAVIGGMVTSGMWDRIAETFEKRYGIKSEVVVSGNKKELDNYVREHQVDFITMHSSDTISNLVADGLFEGLTPWVRNAQMIVGVKSNPAGINPNDTLSEALQKIQRSKTPFIIHPSGGTFEVFHAIKEHYNFTPDTIFLKNKRGSFKEVVAQEGYTLFGVIPFLLKKHSHPMIEGYYSEDVKLMRPYLACIAEKTKITQERYDKAQKLLAFLNSKEAQELITSYRMKGFENYRVFFAIDKTQKEK